MVYGLQYNQSRFSFGEVRRDWVNLRLKDFLHYDLQKEQQMFMTAESHHIHLDEQQLIEQ